jgi:hypothetical protein
MNTHLVSYDLKAPGKDYNNLIHFLKSATLWAKPLESVWLIKTSLSASDFRNQINLHVDKNDKVLVLNVTGDNWATFNIDTQVTDWIKNNL